MATNLVPVHSFFVWLVILCCVIICQYFTAAFDVTEICCRCPLDCILGNTKLMSSGSQTPPTCGVVFTERTAVL